MQFNGTGSKIKQDPAILYLRDSLPEIGEVLLVDLS